MQKLTLNDTWFLEIQHLGTAALNLVCFPWGGGNASAYFKWKDRIEHANIWALKLPGRELRISEKPLTSAARLIDVITDLIPANSNLPLVFYGHSMGGSIAFRTLLELQKKSKQIPVLLIASGCQPPHIKYPNPIANLDDHGILEHIEKIGGLSNRTMITSPEFLRLYLPKIRSDYQLNTSLQLCDPTPLPIVIEIINGHDDPTIELDTLSEWQFHSIHPLSSKIMQGGHFFMDLQFDEFIKHINDCLSAIMESISSIQK